MMEKFQAEEAKPRTKAEIIELLRVRGEDFAAWLETVTPEFLAEMVTEPDGKSAKSRLERLLSAKEHEMHHRGQLMLIERQLGVVPHMTRQFQERVAQMKAARRRRPRRKRRRISGTSVLARVREPQAGHKVWPACFSSGLDRENCAQSLRAKADERA